jgi:hypothetical protein
LLSIVIICFQLEVTDNVGEPKREESERKSNRSKVYKLREMLKQEKLWRKDKEKELRKYRKQMQEMIRIKKAKNM